MNAIMSQNNSTWKQDTAIILTSSQVSTWFYCSVSYINIAIDFAFNYLFCHVTIFRICNGSNYKVMKIQDE